MLVLCCWVGVCIHAVCCCQYYYHSAFIYNNDSISSQMRSLNKYCGKCTERGGMRGRVSGCVACNIYDNKQLVQIRKAECVVIIAYMIAIWYGFIHIHNACRLEWTAVIYIHCICIYQVGKQIDVFEQSTRKCRALCICISHIIRQAKLLL